MSLAARSLPPAAMRVPIILLYGILIVPVQGLMPDDALEVLRADVTRRIVKDRAFGVIIDVSAVETMDSYFTRVLRDLAMTARLMGARTVLAGVPVQVAITMVEMGLDLPGVPSALDLQRALELLNEARARGDLDPDLDGEESGGDDD